jgi:outer membrane protein assembly factor BamB
VAHGTVYVGSGDGFLYAFRAAGCGQPNCQPKWIGVGDGAVAAILSSPAVANGVVYVGKNTNEVLAYSASGCGQFTCAPLWSGLTEDSIVSSSPALVNGTLYIGSSNRFDGAHPGRLYVFNLSVR